MDPDGLGRRPLHQLPLGVPGQGEQEVQPRVPPGDGRAGDGGQRLGEQGAFSAVQVAGAPQVPPVQPLGDEAAQALLLEPGDGAGPVGEGAPVAFQQLDRKSVV